MDVITYDLLLNTRYSGCRQQIQLYKGEVNARKFRIELCHGTNPIVLDPLTCTAIMRGIKADKTLLYNTATITQEGKVEYTLGNQDTAAVGETWYEVQIVSKDDTDTKGRLLYSAQFKAVVNDTAVDDGKITSTSEFGLLTQTIEENKEWREVTWSNLTDWRISTEHNLETWKEDTFATVDDRTLVLKEIKEYKDEDNTTPDPIYNPYYGGSYLEFRSETVEKDCRVIRIENNSTNNVGDIISVDSEGELVNSYSVTAGQTKNIILKGVERYYILIQGMGPYDAHIEQFKFYKYVYYEDIIEPTIKATHTHANKEILDKVEIATALTEMWNTDSNALIPVKLLIEMLQDERITYFLPKAQPGATNYGLVKVAGASETGGGQDQGVPTVWNLYYTLKTLGYWWDTEMSDDSPSPVQNKVIKTYVDNKVKNCITSEDIAQPGENKYGLVKIAGISETAAGNDTNVPIVSNLHAVIRNGEWSDTEMSDDSKAPVQNKVIKAYVDEQTGNLDEKIDTVETIAKGSQKAIVFNNYAELVTHLNDCENDVYQIGQNFYIRQLDVPDVWISYLAGDVEKYVYTTDEEFIKQMTTGYGLTIGEYIVSPLETQKVNLTDYVKNTDYASNGKAGIVSFADVYGTTMKESKYIAVSKATDSEIEALSSDHKPIVPSNLSKAVQTIGGALNNLDTENKVSYVSALNEVLKYATRTKSWRKIRTVTVPGVEAIGTTVNGVKYSGGTPSSDEQIGVCSVTVTTDEDGNVLAGRDITDVAIRFVPVEATNINQGFIQLGDQTVVYFVGLRGASSVSPRRFIVHKAGNYISNDSSNTSKYALQCVNITDIDRINIRGHESTSILGEGATLDFYAYGYWDDLENEEV